jgi:hypothetical protein
VQARLSWSKSLSDAPFFIQTGWTGCAAQADTRQAATLGDISRTAKSTPPDFFDKAEPLLLDPR